jgi:Ribbon-helix-helix protein, copG family
MERPKKHPTHFRLSAYTLGILDHHAKRRGLTRTAMLEEAVHLFARLEHQQGHWSEPCPHTPQGDDPDGRDRR